MISIAICDDDALDLQKAEALVLAYLQEHPNLAARISLFSSGASLLRAMEDSRFDLYLLDILMPGINGIALGERLRRQGDEGQIIYLTTSQDYAIESYEAQALYYLIKPVDRDKLWHALDRAAAVIQKKNQACIFVNVHDGLCKVILDQILYVEQSERCMHFHLIDGSTLVSCVLRGPFSAAVQELVKDPRFLRCGSSFVLNLQRIKSIGKLEAEFSNGLRIHLPRTQIHSVKQCWMEYWLKQGACDAPTCNQFLEEDPR